MVLFDISDCRCSIFDSDAPVDVIILYFRLGVIYLTDAPVDGVI
jgi:hypothetical protein